MSSDQSSRGPGKLPSPGSPPYRPRLSPRDENGSTAAGSSFFAIPPAPPTRGDSNSSNSNSHSAFGFGGSMSAVEGAAKWASLQSGLPTGTGGHSGFNFGGGLSPSSSSATSSAAKAGRPTFEAIRGPSTAMASATPLAQPSGPSPFFPSSTPVAPSSNASALSPNSTFSLPSQSSFSFSQSPAISLPTTARPSQSSAVRLAAGTSTRYSQISASLLLERLNPAPTASPVLVLDMRPHSAHVQSRLRRSVSICVPSTLLRRPAYGIDRVAEGLNSFEQAVFVEWKSADAIVVLDNDSTSLADGMASLLAKFDKAGFTGQLAWVKGGWSAVRGELKRSGVTAKSLVESGEIGQGESAPATTPSRGPSLSHSTSIGKKHARPVLQVRDLPVSAFQQASTSAFAHAGAPSSIAIGGRPTSESTGGDSRPGLGKRRKSTNEGFGLSLDMQMQMAAQEEEPSTPGSESTGEKRMATNPFFDNIRQNSEALSLERSLAHLSPVDLAEIPPTFASILPSYLSALVRLPPMKRAELLARQFYELEVAERERLEGTLHWHANVQGKEDESNKEAQRFKKFGISAGVELGSLNRFKNIFPYDHSRVRLRKFPSGATDYVNASHVHLDGSSKRFIASQGPLPTTYPDFWQLCDQENVGVIVMLTNLHEGGREKCGRYWQNVPDCDWRVDTVGGEEVDAEHAQRSTATQEGGFFAPTSAQEPPPTLEGADSTIRRTIMVQRKTEAPNRPPRKIRHIQYRAWPDFDVPAAPEDVVALVKEVEAAQAEYMREIDWQGAEEPPIVTHCSAGCGRTGVFILVSAVLEKMRKDRTDARRGLDADAVRNAVEVVDQMELDSPVTFGENLQQPSTNPFEFPGTPGTPSLNLATPAPPPPFPSFPRATSTTPSSLIPQTASLSLAPDSRPFLAHSHSSQSDPYALKSTASPIDKLPVGLGDEGLRALESVDPIFAGVASMRQQRMSMVANYRQYVCVHECVLVGALQEIEMEMKELRSVAAAS